MSKKTFIDGNPSLGVMGTIVDAAFLNALNNHRHGGRDVDGEGAIDYAVATGSGGNYAISLTPALDTHIPGMLIAFKANHENTGSATLAVNGMSAVAIVRTDGSTLLSGDIINGQIIVVTYNGSVYQAMSILSSQTIPAGINGTCAMATAPDGWVPREGGEYSMTTYKRLYFAIGVMYGKDTGTTVTFNPDANYILCTAHGRSNGDIIQLSNSGGSLPTGLSAATTYYIVNQTTDSFQVATTIGGNAVDFTGSGSGTSKYHWKFKVPDVRGDFPRYWDHGVGRDPDRASRTDRGDGTTGDNVGTKEGEAFKLHSHTILPNGTGYNPQLTGAYGMTINYTNDGTTVIGSAGGNETRPRNVNEMPIIKY